MINSESILNGESYNINIKDREVVHRILMEIESSENKQRKIREFKAYEVRSGSVRRYVLQELKRVFSETYSSFTISDLSISKRVTEKRAQAYNEAPVRVVSESEEGTAKYKEITDKAKLNNSMKSFDAIFNCHWAAGVWIQPPLKEGESYRAKALKPFEYDLVVNYKGEVLCVAIKFVDNEITQGGDGQRTWIQNNQYDQAASTKVYGLWTKDSHVVAKYTTLKDGSVSISSSAIDGNEMGINPIGKLPFVFIQANDDESLPFNNPLCEQTITYNFLNSIRMTIAEMQGMSNLVITGVKDVVDQDINMSLFAAIKVRQPDDSNMPQTTVDYISPSPDLAGFRDIVNDYYTSVLKEHGVYTGESITSDGAEKYSSGYDRLLSMASIVSIVTDNQDRYSQVEKKVFDIINSYQQLLGSSIGESLSVQFKRMAPMISEPEILELITKKRELGLIEEWEKFRALDPNIDETAAREKLAKIEKERNARVNELFSSPQDEQGSRQGTTDVLS